MGVFCRLLCSLLMSSPAEPTSRPTISVAMIARNEERNLPRTLLALRWVDQVVIVDSGSSDTTPQIAREFGAEHSFHRDFQGHAEQKNVAIRRCSGDWILLLDADEVVTPELAAEIQRAVRDSQYQAYWIPRLNFFLTRWMRHGGLYPDRKLRLFRRGAAMVDESIGPHGTPSYGEEAGVLTCDLHHYGYPDFAMYLDHMNEYSTATVTALGKKTARQHHGLLLLQAFFHPAFGWLKNYVLRGGFQDGAEGLIFHWNHAVYVHWKYIKVWEARKRGSPDAQSELPT